MEEEWVISIRELCAKAKVPFFFKQWGGVQKSKAGRILQNRTYDALPQISMNRVLSKEKRDAALLRVEEVSKTFLVTA